MCDVYIHTERGQGERVYYTSSSVLSRKPGTDKTETMCYVNGYNKVNKIRRC